MVHDDRRSPNRPHPGETRVCPKCAAMMRFEERFSIVAGQIQSDPGWICPNKGCGHESRVRLGT